MYEPPKDMNRKHLWNDIVLPCGSDVFLARTEHGVCNTMLSKEVRMKKEPMNIFQENFAFAFAFMKNSIIL